MVLIIFLGLIAKLALVSCDCEFGTLPMNDFNWTKFADSRTWVFVYHNFSDFENNLDCPKAIFSSPEGNRSFVTTDVFDKSEQRHIIQYGNATNWNSNGCHELDHPVCSWSGHHCVIAFVYDHYFISKSCTCSSNNLTIYVAFRSSHPDEETVNAALKDLQDNNIDVNKLAEWERDHC